ncbi:MAG: HAD-IA family hydrolase [Planctomycetota bacterium]
MSQPTPDIQLVVFDLGRVLLRIADSFDHACERAGVPHIPGMQGDLSIHARRASDPDAAKLFDDYETGRVSTPDYLNHASHITGTPHDTLLAVLDAVLIEPFPGVPDLLDQLAARPVKTACLSNTNARHEALFTDPNHSAYTPVHRLDFPLYSHTIHHAKPHPDAYATVENTTQTDPHHILFFDDLDANTAAANERGWHTVLVPRCDNPIPLITEQLQAYRVL